MSHEVVLRALSQSTYFVRDEGQAEPVLRELLEQGFDIRRAWYATENHCSIDFVYWLVVELKAPDARILDYGVNVNRDQFQPAVCIPWWFQYTFDPLRPAARPTLP